MSSSVFLPMREVERGAAHPRAVTHSVLAGTLPEPPTGWARPRLALLVLLAAAILGSAGCQAHAQTGPQQTTGLIIDVQARSIAAAEAITLRTADGRELTLRVDPGVDVTPGHLREHMTLGEPVRVTYQQTSDGLLATRIDDV